MSQLDDLYNFFMNDYTIHTQLGTTVSESDLPEGFWKRDNATDPFLSVDERWNNDDVFAQARLMATNPVQIQRVTLRANGIGMHLNRLERLLNKTFQWDKHFQSTVGVSFRKVREL